MAKRFFYASGEPLAGGDFAATQWTGWGSWSVERSERAALMSGAGRFRTYSDRLERDTLADRYDTYDVATVFDWTLEPTRSTDAAEGLTLETEGSVAEAEDPARETLYFGLPETDDAYAVLRGEDALRSRGNGNGKGKGWKDTVDTGEEPPVEEPPAEEPPAEEPPAEDPPAEEPPVEEPPAEDPPAEEPPAEEPPAEEPPAEEPPAEDPPAEEPPAEEPPAEEPPVEEPPAEEPPAEEPPAEEPPVEEPPASDPGPVRAFFGAEGYGADTTGGRGGVVIKVTNSNDSGVGSLRWAIENHTGPRIIVFEVNEVNLTSNIQLTNGDVTIAGQTAGGVQITGATIRIADDNVIMRGMKFRVGDGAESDVDAGSRDGLIITGGSKPIQNIIIDHNSFEWAIDENIDIWKDVSYLTLSNNIIAQGLSESIHPKGEHSKGLLIGSYSAEERAHELSIIDNLFAFNNARNPRIADGYNIEIANNYIYGAGAQYRAIEISNIRDQNAEYINILHNYIEAGPESQRSSEPGVLIQTRYNYAEGNITVDVNGVVVGGEYHGAGVGYMLSAPIASSGLDLLDATEVKAYVLTNAGANPFDRDAPDQAVIDLILAGAGGLVDSVTEAGGYADFPFTPPTDTDNDGMPDWFEDRYGFDKTRFDSNGDSDGDGYTNIEEYINGLYTGFQIGPVVDEMIP